MNAGTASYPTIQTIGYGPYLYGSIAAPSGGGAAASNVVKQSCLAFCMTEVGDQCHFIVLDSTTNTCYLGRVADGGPWISPVDPITGTREVVFPPPGDLVILLVS